MLASCHFCHLYSPGPSHHTAWTCRLSFSVSSLWATYHYSDKMTPQIRSRQGHFLRRYLSVAKPRSLGWPWRIRGRVSWSLCGSLHFSLVFWGRVSLFSLKLIVLLSRPPKCWYYRSVLSCLAVLLLRLDRCTPISGSPGQQAPLPSTLFPNSIFWLFFSPTSFKFSSSATEANATRHAEDASLSNLRYPRAPHCVQASFWISNHVLTCNAFWETFTLCCALTWHVWYTREGI